MKIIILGARGQIGTQLYSHLRQKHTVIGTSRASSDVYFRFDPFRDPWSMLGECDVLINCAGQIEPEKAMSFHRIHVELTQLILSNREAMGNPKIIQISALGASSESAIEFLKTKGVADNLLLAHHNTVAVRPSIVCTHKTMIVRKMLMLSRIARFTLGLIAVPSGFLTTRIQPIMPIDLAKLVEVLCLSDAEGILNAVGPEALSFAELMEMLFLCNLQKVRIMEIPGTWTTFAVTRILIPLFPKLIAEQQYQLLFVDNTADAAPIQKLLNSSLSFTRPFFINEFSHADH
jgi:uncharacterized protein YbjT (DUF2867 family)